MADEKVKLLGYWASPFALRVHWALKLKGIEYLYQEEDLPNKSPLLLQHNPVHKKIPVLVHNGKPIAESLVILEYIEETWKHNPLLPEDPYERAKARFWAKFVDDKCVPGIFGTFAKVGEEQQKIAKEARENLKILEGELGKKRLFGDTKVGFMDVASAWIICWAQIVEEVVDVKLIDSEEMPSLVSWFQNVLEAAPVLKECTPPKDKLLEHNKGFHKMLVASASP